MKSNSLSSKTKDSVSDVSGAKLTYPHRFSVAPMMDWTTSECRQFHRLLTSQALLYTEMVTTGAILHGDRQRFLRYDDMEHPLAIQLGGSDPRELAQCAKLAEDAGYDEINLNVGCPSDRVQNGMIGAVLMGHKELVADAVKAMMDAVSIPVTVKHRIGIDDLDSYQFLTDFVGAVANAGCQTFIVHARKAILKGLSPKENREIPPLNYERVIELKRDFDSLNIIINGGIKSHQAAQSLIEAGLDGVMVGREAYQNPLFLTAVDELYYQQPSPNLTSKQLNEALLVWTSLQVDQQVPLKFIARHMLGLYQGQPGSRQFRRFLSENMHRENADMDTLKQGLDLIQLPDEVFVTI